MAHFLEKIFGSFNDKEVKRLMKTVDQIEKLEPEYEGLRDEALRAKTLNLGKD